MNELYKQIKERKKEMNATYSEISNKIINKILGRKRDIDYGVKNFLEGMGIPSFPFFAESDPVGDPTPDPINDKSPLVGFTGGLTLNGFTEDTLDWATPNQSDATAFYDTRPYRNGIFYHIHLENLNINTKLGFYTGTFNSGKYTYGIDPTFYYNSLTGLCFAGSSQIGQLPTNLKNIFIYIDEDLNLHFGQTPTNYILMENMNNFKPLFNSNDYGLRLGITQNKSINEIPISTYTVLSSGYKEYSNIATEGITYPNLGINNNTRFIKTTIQTISQFKRNNITYIIPKNFGDLVSFTIKCYSSNINNLQVVVGNNVADGSYSLRPTAFGTNYIGYDAQLNYLFDNNGNIGFPLFPYSNINSINGYIYVKIDSLKRVYIGKSKDNSMLAGTLNITGPIGIGLITNGLITQTGEWGIVLNNESTAVPSSPPLNPLFNQPALTGYTTSGVVLVNGATTHTLNGLVQGRFYSYIQSPIYSYGTSVYYNVQITQSNNTRIGFYTDGSIVSGNTDTATSTNPPQFYYNSSNGGCYAGTEKVTFIEPGLTSLFIMISETFDFYVGRTTTNYVEVCNIFDYPLLTNNVTNSFRLGYEINP